MKLLKVEGIGKSNPDEFDFCVGIPAFIAEGDELSIIVSDGTTLVGVTLPILEAESSAIQEIRHPNYVAGMVRGAVYYVKSARMYVIDLCTDGCYFGTDTGSMEYYPFEADFEDIVEAGSYYNIDPYLLQSGFVGSTD